MSRAGKAGGAAARNTNSALQGQVYTARNSHNVRGIPTKAQPYLNVKLGIKKKEFNINIFKPGTQLQEAQSKPTGSKR